MRASWIARLVASPSVSGGRVSACQRGSVWPAASAWLDEHVDHIAVLGVHHHERPGPAATSIVRKSVSSSTISAPL